MKRLCLSVLAAIVMSVAMFAQSAEQEVSEVIDALAVATRAGDKAAASKLIADDLRWIDPLTGALQDKARRLALLVPGGGPPRLRDRDVKAYGDTAVVMEVADVADRSLRVHRVLVKRGGQWQLVSFSATFIDPKAK
jgi:ketosteroid isomerase-like protein